MKALEKLVHGKKFGIFLDFEGTQFSHEIISIGAVKCSFSKTGKIINKKNFPTFKVFVKCLGQIGTIVTRLTSIDETILKEKGITLEEAFTQFKSFVDVPFSECTFFVFGSNDVKMITDSISYSNPKNLDIGYSICKNTIDYLAFISQYCKDKNGNNYSLVNYLELFGGKPNGVSHDPLNDAIDLMNLYKGVYTNKETLKEEYIKTLSKQKYFPTPIKTMVKTLTEGKVVTPEKFEKEIKKFLE